MSAQQVEQRAIVSTGDQWRIRHRDAESIAVPKSLHAEDGRGKLAALRMWIVHEHQAVGL